MKQDKIRNLFQQEKLWKSGAEQYGDIIHLPRHQSTKHMAMSMEERAAQFAPFAALETHKSEIQETARLTDPRHEVDEGSMEEINRVLQEILELPKLSVQVQVRYFQEDLHKEGGQIIEKEGMVRRVEEHRNCMEFADYSSVQISDIIGIKRVDKYGRN